MKFNFNDYVKVKLTSEALTILENRKELYGEPDSEGYYSFQLWELMSFFGSYCYNGGPDLFVNSILEIDENQKYEIFLDESYYSMWCVRNRDDKRFDSPTSFHFPDKTSAENFLKLISKAQ